MDIENGHTFRTPKSEWCLCGSLKRSVSLDSRKPALSNGLELQRARSLAWGAIENAFGHPVDAGPPEPEGGCSAS